jgi:hypothetical protein
MRLKSMKLRRAEVEKQEAERLTAAKDETVKLNARRPSVRPRPPRRPRRGGVGLGRGHRRGRQAIHHPRPEETRGGRSQDRDTQRTPELSLEKAGRDQGGGFDPYNQRVRQAGGEAATRQGVTGSKERDRSAALDRLYGKKKP